jgi:cytochrome c oxidase subunit 2
MEEQQESQPTGHRPPVPRVLVVRLAIVGVIATAIGIVIGLEIPWFPPAAATQAHTIDTMYRVLIICTIPIFVLVTSVVLFSVWRFRMRPGEELLDGPPIHGNTRLEVIWTALPATLIASLVVYAAIVLHDIGVKKPNEITVNVVGRQWEWSFTYPHYLDGSGGTAKPIVTPVLELPVNRPVNFLINAVDVIHTFYVPAFRLQQDAVPGITTNLRATPTRVGVYPVVCTQLCGYGHATMRTTLYVVKPAVFQAWLAAHGYPGATTAAAVHRASTHLTTSNALIASAQRGARTTTKEGSQ